jgi:CRISPR-associated protein Cmr1
MEKITFQCEVITPMFLAGADGKTPELRPTSIKGAMRFWWRAMNGHLPLEHSNERETLRYKEAEIFGSSDEKVGKSKFSIVIPQDKVLISNNVKEYKPLPHHSGDVSCVKLPACGSRNNPNKCSKGFPLPCIPVGTGFSLDIKVKDQRIKNDVKNLFILTTILGSFGKRSRRGFGSVKITKINDIVYNSPISLEDIFSLLNSINTSFIINQNSIQFTLTVNHNYPYIRAICIGDPKSDLLKVIGDESSNNNDRALGFAEKINRESKRMASPIYVSVIKNTQNECIPIITTLNTAFEKGITGFNMQKQDDFRSALL